MATMCKSRAITLLEILIALVVLAIAVFPLIRVFSTSYVLTSKQAFQEQALKIAEAAIAKLMAIPFESLDIPQQSSIDLPFEIVSANGTFNGNIALEGQPVVGTGSVDIGRVTYQIQVKVTREFAGPAGGPIALMFYYPTSDLGVPLPPSQIPSFIPWPPPVGYSIATYSCPDSFLRIAVKVSNPESLPVHLATFRADLRQ